MKALYRNLFYLFGVVAVIFMLYGFGVDFNDLQERLSKAGLYLPAVVGIWVVVYAFNAGAFQAIVNSGTHDKHLDFRHAMKLTISGFAFSYTTPFGVGGAPYRVMELKAHIGTHRAMSSTALYSLMHILSHFLLWATGLVVFIIYRNDLMHNEMWLLASIFALVFFIVLYFFYYGYRNGMIVKLYSLLLYLPFIKRFARKFWNKNKEAMEQVDANIAYLHTQPRAFYTALAMEYAGRLFNAFEFFFILLSLSIPANYADALIILAFSSLIGNILFFFPMQLGAREGSLAMIVRILGFGTPSIGIFTSFYTRIRELFWIIVGVSLVKVGNKKLMK